MKKLRLNELPPSGTVDFLIRSDDYGNGAASFNHARGSYRPALIPLLVRGLDLTRDSSTPFSIVLMNGETVQAEAFLSGGDRIPTPGGDIVAERITLSYSRAIPSPAAEESGSRTRHDQAVTAS